ncbi:MAG: hypothetical protein JRM86_02040 [Nitrososphaerota archaeon]|nr:hypothetical protein [Nitrososphaerota archaeon]
MEENANRLRRVDHLARGTRVELQVADDLIARGFDVFRNLSPRGPVGMMALARDGSVLKVQATIGHVGKRTSTRTYNAHAHDDLWDVIAVAYPDGVRYYGRDKKDLELSPSQALELPRPSHPARKRPRPEPTSPRAAAAPSAEELEDAQRRRWLAGCNIRELGANPSRKAIVGAIRQANETRDAERLWEGILEGRMSVEALPVGVREKMRELLEDRQRDAVGGAAYPTS